jgi:SAM-dependent methyltransferase
MADGVEVAASPASSLAAFGASSLAPYWRFQRSVAKAQFAAWLPAPGRLLIDISGPSSFGAVIAAARGHTVVRVLPAYPGSGPKATATGQPGRAASGVRLGHPRSPQPESSTSTREHLVNGHARPGRIVQVVADPASLAFLADSCADGVIAEDGALSRHLMSEDLAAEIARVLRPGGELLACVDSLVLGMAILAEQHHWAHLTDLPHSEVVLIPWPDGRITRCFGAGQLQDLLTEAGLQVNWITPRTVLSPSMVDHVLRQDPGAMARLVHAELRAERDRRPAGSGSDESFGISLLAAACKPPAPGHGPARHRRITKVTKRTRRRTIFHSPNPPTD